MKLGINFKPLGTIDKSKRSLDHNKIKKEWKKAVIIIYSLLVLRLLFNSQFKDRGLIGKILSPILFVLNFITK
jgi:K+ transporter